MASIITVLVDDAEAAMAALAALAPPPPATSASAPSAAPAAPLAAPSVSAQIAAVPASQGLSALSSLATSLSAGVSALPSGAIVAAEDLAGMIDPALIPVIAGIQAVMPLVTLALGMLEGGTPATQNYWLGAPNAI
jgi:hypothetical protein